MLADEINKFLTTNGYRSFPTINGNFASRADTLEALAILRHIQDCGDYFNSYEAEEFLRSDCVRHMSYMATHYSD